METKKGKTKEMVEPEVKRIWTNGIGIQGSKTDEFCTFFFGTIMLHYIGK